MLKSDGVVEGGTGEIKKQQQENDNANENEVIEEVASSVKVED